MDVLIDTDTGLGDARLRSEDGLAIALALAPPEVIVQVINLRAGETSAEATRTLNAAHLLRVLDRTDVPLAAGAERPLVQRQAPLRWLAERAACERVTPAAQPPAADPRAAHRIVQTANACDGLTLIAIGPLTNVAAALVAEPGVADRIERIVVMGGAFEVPGNVTPTAEFNCLTLKRRRSCSTPACSPCWSASTYAMRCRSRTGSWPKRGSTARSGASCARLRRVAPGRRRNSWPYLYDSLAVAAALSRAAHARAGVCPD